MLKNFHFFDQSLHFCTSLHPKIDANHKGQRLRKYTRWEALRYSKKRSMQEIHFTTESETTSSVLRPTRIAPDCAPPFVRDARTRYRRGSRPSGMFCFRAGHLDHCHRYSTPAGPGDEYLRVRSILCTPLRLHVGSPRRTAGIVRWAHAESLLTVPRNL